MHTSIGKVMSILEGSVPEYQHVADQVLLLLRTRAAHFVSDHRIAQLIGRNDVQDGFLAMAHAEVLNLPFDPLLVEFHDPMRPGFNFVYLSTKPLTEPTDRRNGDLAIDLFAYPLSITSDPRPSHEGGWIMATVDPVDPVLVTFGREGATIPYTVTISRHSDPIMDRGKQQLGIDVAEAMSIAFLMLNTRGIDKVHVDTAKLNKARSKHGKPRINPYSILKIGTIYDRDGNAHSAAGSGRHMPVHWRCGHVRNQRYGPAWGESRKIFIPACLVNYDPAVKPDTVPLPKHEVTL